MSWDLAIIVPERVAGAIIFYNILIHIKLLALTINPGLYLENAGIPKMDRKYPAFVLVFYPSG